MFHELATNSAKYGALGAENGTVEIALEAGDPVCLRWIEYGIAKTGEAIPGGFGTRLIDMSINRQLGGSYVTTWGENSLVVAISVPSGNVQRA